MPTRHASSRPEVVAMIRRAFLLGSIAVLAGSCAQAADVDTPENYPCLCEPNGCPADRCNLDLEVAAGTCTGQLTQVEVLLGDQLEWGTWKTGERRSSCATWPAGTTIRLQARSDTDWLWVEDVECPAPSLGATIGVSVARKLQCAEVLPAGDATTTTDGDSAP